MDRAVLLGYDAGKPRLAIPLGIRPDDEQNFDLPEPLKAIDYRSIAAQFLLPNEELGQLAQGAAYLAWHSSSRYCGRCGSETLDARRRGETDLHFVRAGIFSRAQTRSSLC